jgi:hypothetical protein
MGLFLWCLISFVLPRVWMLPLPLYRACACCRLLEICWSRRFHSSSSRCKSLGSVVRTLPLRVLLRGSVVAEGRRWKYRFMTLYAKPLASGKVNKLLHYLYLRWYFAIGQNTKWVFMGSKYISERQCAGVTLLYMRFWSWSYEGTSRLIYQGWWCCS